MIKKLLPLFAFCTFLFTATATIADDIPPTDNGSSTGGPTGAQNVPADSGSTSTIPASKSNDPAMSAINEKCGGKDANAFDPNSKEIKIFSLGVKCFETITANLAETTIQKFSAFLAHIVYILLVLYVIVFGNKVAIGLAAGGRLRGEAFMTAFKFCIVAFLVFGYNNGFNLGVIAGGFSFFGSLGIDQQPGLLQIYTMTISAYHSLIQIVLPTNGFGSCNVDGGSAMSFGSNGTDAVWQNMDCLFSKFIGWNAKNGYATGSGLANKGGIALLFGLITSKIAPANGFIIGGVLAGALLALLMAFFRLAFVYILSMIALILIFSVGPLFIPLMLFEKTKQYFENWYKLILGTIMQPVILFAFFSFCGGLISSTVDKMEKLYEQLKPTMETAKVTRTGSEQTFDAQSVFDAIGKLDKEAILNGVSILVIAYLLISFISFVSDMAAELAGTQQLRLGNFVPTFAGGR